MCEESSHCLFVRCCCEQRCTLVDWEVAAAGTPLLDVIYCIWMCSEPGRSGSSMPSQRGGDCDSLLSDADWRLVEHWQKCLGRTVGRSWDNFAPLVEQVAVVSLLLAAQAWAIRGAGFAEAWADGNNNADLVSTHTRRAGPPRPQPHTRQLVCCACLHA